MKFELKNEQQEPENRVILDFTTRGDSGDVDIFAESPGGHNRQLIGYFDGSAGDLVLYQQQPERHQPIPGVTLNSERYIAVRKA
jgi:hypothetical protein